MPVDLLENLPKRQPRDLLAGPVEATEQPSTATPAGAFQQGAMQGMTLGFMDELLAGVYTPIEAGIDLAQGKGLDIPRAYSRGLEKARAGDRRDTQGQEGYATAGNVAGALLTGSTAAKGGLTLMNAAKPNAVSMGTRGALEGAIYGGLYGAGESEGDLGQRAQDAGKGALFGAGMGGLVGGVSGAIASRQANKAVPTIQQLKDEAGQLYRAAEKSGVTASRQQTGQLAGQLRGIATKEGVISPTGRIAESYPKLRDVLAMVDDYANGTMSVEQMQTVRRTLRNAAGSADKTERRIGVAMLREFDDFTATLAPELAQARAIYHRAGKAEAIDELVELAQSRAGQFSGSGFENALRTEFRGLERRIIKGQERRFSPAEFEAIKQVSRGGPWENFFRQIGKAAPRGPVSTGLSAGVPFMIGNAVGGPPLGAAASATTMAAGEMGRKAATAMTSRNARIAEMLMRSGGQAPKALPVQNAVTQALIAGGASQMPKVAKSNPAVVAELIRTMM